MGRRYLQRVRLCRRRSLRDRRWGRPHSRRAWRL